MSETAAPQIVEANQHSQEPKIERSINRVQSMIIPGGKGRSITLRPESPRTEQAMMELGYEKDYFKIKPFEEFLVPNVPEEISKLRYDHQINRINQGAKDVLARRKEIIAQRRASLLQSNKTITTATQLGSNNNLNDSIQSPKQLNSSIILNSSSVSNFPKELLEPYSKTISYLKSSHKSPEIIDPEDVFQKHGSDMEGVIGMKMLLEEEIDKYNRLKMHKQKEAKFLYEDEKKRYEISRDLKQKEDQVTKMNSHKKNEHDKKIEAHNHMLEEKKQKLKEIEREYRKRKLDEAKRQEQRMKELREKQQIEKEERDKQRLVSEENSLERKRKYEKLKEDNLKAELDLCQERKEKLMTKISQSSDKYQEIIQKKIVKLRERAVRDHKIFLDFQERRQTEERENFINVLSKLKEKEQKNKVVQQKNLKDELEKKKEKEKKENEFEESQKKLKRGEKSRVNKLNDKMKKMEETLEQKKREDEMDLMMKKELRILKEQDKLENYDRQKRINDFKLNKSIQKNRYHQDKMNQLRLEQEVLKRARLEVSHELKQEKDRIFNGISSISNILNSQKPNKTSLKLSKSERNKSLKILKAIIVDKDVDTKIFMDPEPTNSLERAMTTSIK